MSTKAKTPGNKTFATSLRALVLGLIGVVVLLMALNFMQRPHIRRAEIDALAATKQSNQRLTLYANQPLGNISKQQVSIEPQASFEVSNSNQAVIVQFNERLRYSSTYRVSIKNVTNTYRRGATTSLNYSFKTTEPTLFYLHHANGSLGALVESESPDEIVQTTLDGKEKATVFSSKRILDYVRSGNNLVVAAANDDKTHSLYRVDLQTKKTSKLPLPASGTVDKLEASPNQRLVGFSFTSNEKTGSRRYENTLFNIDLASGEGIVYQLTGFVGKPLQVMDWRFAPDGTTVLAQLTDSSVLLVDTTGKHMPVPLGQFGTIENFSFDGSKVALRARNTTIILDLINHTSTTMPNEKDATYLMNIRLLANSEGYIKQTSRFEQATKYQQRIALTKGSSEQELYEQTGFETTIPSFETSPNDQYAAIHLNTMKATANSTADQTPHEHTLILDTDEGKTIADIDGVNIIWR
jgi:hypothetical protein